MSKKSKEKAKAKDEIVKSIRDLLSLNITLPLGNPNLKLVHTNQFCTTELPSSFLLKNFKVISKALGSSYNRNIGYTKNKWYIEGCTITNNGDNFSMSLDLNPFASTLMSYRDNRDSYLKAFKDAVEAEKKKTEKQEKQVKSTGNKGVTGGEGKTIDDLVKKIIGKETNELKKAKLIHNWLLKNRDYKYYACSKYHSPEACLKNRSHLNCADTARLTASMMRSAGLDAEVVHYYHPNNGHFWTVVKINGKEYASDATSKRRKFNTVLRNMKYNKRNGKKPDC